MLGNNPAFAILSIEKEPTSGSYPHRSFRKGLTMTISSPTFRLSDFKNAPFALRTDSGTKAQANNAAEPSGQGFRLVLIALVCGIAVGIILT
ncbi:hypothetical protein K8942_04510 [Candidatus Peribacteria bacterium]|nr:MAG: hypothetical protein K8942_04510 [Candidatus Peribacteria bacterium]